MKKRIFIHAARFLALAILGGNVFAQSYSISLLGVGNGNANTYATAINNSGEVVGYSSTSGGQEAVYWNANGVATVLPSLGGSNSQANAINDAGQIVGSSALTSGYYYTIHAALWSKGSVKDLGSLNGQNSSAYGINQSGVIVGQASNGDVHALIWNNEKISYLQGLGTQYDSGAFGVDSAGEVAGTIYPGYGYTEAISWQNGKYVTISPAAYASSSSAAAAINDSGQIVGYSGFNGCCAHAALWSKGTMTDLGALQGNDTPISAAMAINNHGAIVGTSNVIGVGSTAGRATLWDDGSITDLNSYLSASLRSAGWHLYAATGINDSGEIVGNAYNSSTGQYAAFGATALAPVPSISNIQPSSIDAGSPAFVLTVNGTKFVSGDTIEWNGVPLSTTYVSATKLTAKVSAADVATAGSAAVTVVDTVGGNVVSKPALFVIPLTSIVISTQTIKTISGGYAITLTLRNSGFNTATDIAITGAYLATSASLTPLPLDIASIAPGGNKPVTVSFPSSAGKAGEAAYLLLYGSYVGGGISLNDLETIP
jgi:probable HAF family extracellular repeat protein